MQFTLLENIAAALLFWGGAVSLAWAMWALTNREGGNDD